MPFPGVARSLTRCGAIGAGFFVAVFLVAGALRPGHDPIRDTVSELALGPWGWVQVANFVITGLLMIAFAVGLAWTLRSGRAYTWTPRLIAAYGSGIVLAGVFVTDPVPSAAHTWHGTLHLAASLLTFGALTAVCFVVARRFPDRRWAWYSRVTGAAVAVLFVAMGAGPPAAIGLVQRAAIIVGWTWIAAISLLARSARVQPEALGEPSGDDSDWD